MTSTAIKTEIDRLSKLSDSYCYAGDFDAAEALRDQVDQLHADLHSVLQEEANRAPLASAGIVADASEAQINFIATLAGERDWDAIGSDVAQRFQAIMEMGVSKAKASEIIDWLKKQPRKVVAATPKADTGLAVPDGYYAVAMAGHKNDVTFYRLRTGKRGKWQGFQFIDLLASTTPYPVRGKDARAAVYTAIREAGINEARAAFGQKLGRCGVCNRPLTDETSRALGIGPECRKGI